MHHDDGIDFGKFCFDGLVDSVVKDINKEILDSLSNYDSINADSSYQYDNKTTAIPSNISSGSNGVVSSPYNTSTIKLNGNSIYHNIDTVSTIHSITDTYYKKEEVDEKFTNLENLMKTNLVNNEDFINQFDLILTLEELVDVIREKFKDFFDNNQIKLNLKKEVLNDRFEISFNEKIVKLYFYKDLGDVLFYYNDRFYIKKNKFLNIVKLRCFNRFL